MGVENIHTLTAQYLLYPEETIQKLTRFVNNEEEEFLPWGMKYCCMKIKYQTSVRANSGLLALYMFYYIYIILYHIISYYFITYISYYIIYIIITYMSYIYFITYISYYIILYHIILLHIYHIISYISLLHICHIYHN